MRWFEGNIVEAVTQSKARNAVFVVFVEGKDETSQKIASTIDDADISSKLEGSNFVSIHLESGTVTFTQFSQIYRDPPVPSLYFIGRNGSPIEIVTKVSDSKHLMEKIVQIENIHIGKSTPSEISPAQLSNQSTTPHVFPGQSSSTHSTESVISKEADASQPSTSSGSLDDRVERAKELLEEKRIKKRVQEEEEERQKELQRRKEGQNVQELRRWQQELELKQLKEERMREKRQEQEARQKVLEQIAQDRAARNSRNTPSTSLPVVSQPASVSSSIPSNSHETRLQFRLPDGSTHCNRFNADTTLAEVRQYILSNLSLPYQDFTLSTVFPRHEFSAQDNASTLRDLQLVPSSVMIIVPAGGGVVENRPGLVGLVQTIWLFMTLPVKHIFSILQRFIFAGPPVTQNQSSDTAAGSASTKAQNQSNNQQEKRSERRNGGAYRRAANSNVHRLHQNHSSSDDENNTWNGNSTQQM